jgi:hypothetical protein
MSPLPPACEAPILSRFLRAEAMALWAVKAAQGLAPVPVLAFLKHHEEEEREHLKLFEGLTGESAREREVLPKLPRQWHALAVHLYGYEALGLEFARLLAGLRPDLSHVLADEEGHVAFFEAEIRRLLATGGGPANGARDYAAAWMRRLPQTLDRYLQGEALEPFKSELADRILGAIQSRFSTTGLSVGA